MGKAKYQNYRVCYENGNSTTGAKIYELYKYCRCSECQHRQATERTPANRINITTKDISKIDEIVRFLENWSCKDGKRQLEIVFLKF